MLEHTGSLSGLCSGACESIALFFNLLLVLLPFGLYLFFTLEQLLQLLAVNRHRVAFSSDVRPEGEIVMVKRGVVSAMVIS
jgi:hypothetical protein